MTTDATPVVEMAGLSKRYGDIRAVDGLDITVQRGEIYGLLGPNGAGKTTTLGMLTGLIRPTDGAIRVFGHPPHDRAAVAQTGSLIEQPGLYPYLSGRDNLRVLARYAGAARARVAEVLDLVDLTDRAGDRFATYSLGMKQRLGVAAALLNDPALVILDEPTNGLDPAGMRDMGALIRRLAAHEQTVVLSSHLLDEVQQLCDRVGIIRDGRMVAENDVEELRSRDELLISAWPVADAEKVLRRYLDTSNVRRDGEHLRVEPGSTSAATLNRALVEAGVDVGELRTVERQLEELFFELTADAAATGGHDAR